MAKLQCLQFPSQIPADILNKINVEFADISQTTEGILES